MIELGVCSDGAGVGAGDMLDMLYMSSGIVKKERRPMGSVYVSL